MRLLLVGAFGYPHAQGSQVYFQEQAIALRAAGAEVELLTYANGSRPCPEAPQDWRALDGFVHHKAPVWTAPSTLRSGPSWQKPLADLGLAWKIRDAVASKMTRGLKYDAVLTHHAEATFAARAASASLGKAMPPIVYCVHTLLERELSTYSKHPQMQHLSDGSTGPGRAATRRGRRRREVLDGIGRRIDRSLARSCSAWIALTQSSDCVMRHYSDAPGALIPPPIPDPRLDPDRLDPAATARRFGLEPGNFHLYSGNLDAYQELELLSQASALRRGGDARVARSASSPRNGSRRDSRSEIVIASHDPSVLHARALRGGDPRRLSIATQSEMRALLGAARASLVMRRTKGGFPIKLVNSLAETTAPICFLEGEWGLEDRTNAFVARGARPAAALAAALDELDRSPELARRLGAGARTLYEARHRPEAVARRTLELLEALLRRPSGGGLRRHGTKRQRRDDPAARDRR